MKIRIKGNTVRLRLSQSEVATLGRQNEVADSISFGPDQSLDYILQRSAEAKQVTATFSERKIYIELPDPVALSWVSSDQISITATQENAVAGGLSILIEKDFRCLTERVGENEEDLFPHPKEGEVNC